MSIGLSLKLDYHTNIITRHRLITLYKIFLASCNLHNYKHHLRFSSNLIIALKIIEALVTETLELKSPGMADNTSFTVPNCYWRPKDYDRPTAKQLKDMLEARRYYTGSVMEKKKLRECLKRSDRGLLSYLKYTNDELRELIRIRGIDTDSISGDKGHRGELIDALEKEDDNRSFGSFTQLPAELRARIYKYYFEDLEDSLHAPKQPPLTRVSRLLREETLPLFYSTCTFDFNLVVSKDGLSKYTLKMPSMTLMWLRSTEDENIADIAKIRVRVCRESRSLSPKDQTLDSFLRHENTALDFQLRRCDTGCCMRMNIVLRHTPWTDRLRLKNNVWKAVRGVVGVGEKRKMTKSVFFAIRRAVEVSIGS